MFRLDAFNNLKTKGDYDRLREAFALQRDQNRMQREQQEQGSMMNQMKMMAMEKEMNAPEQVKLKSLAEQALLKQNQGQPLTQQEAAAIQTMGQIAPPSYTTNEYGMPIAQPSGWSNVLGQRPQDVVNRPPQEVMGGMPQAAPQGSPSQVMPQPSMPPQAMQQPSMQEQFPVGGMSPIGQPFRAFGEVAGKPMGEIMENKTAAAVSEYGSKKAIDAGYEQAKQVQEKQAERREEDFAFSSALNQSQVVDDAINKIVEQVSPYNTGIVGANNPFSQAGANIESLLKTVESDATLNKLLELKKAGGTLGQVTEKELGLLASSRAALQRQQDPVQFIDQLKKYQQRRNAAIRNIANAYQEQFGQYPTGYDTPKAPRRMSLDEALKEL